MAINPESRMRRTREAYYGWREGDKYFLSLKPRDANAARNEYETSTDALREASERRLLIVWDKPEEIE